MSVKGSYRICYYYNSEEYKGKPFILSKIFTYSGRIIPDGAKAPYTGLEGMTLRPAPLDFHFEVLLKIICEKTSVLDVFFVSKRHIL